MKQYTWEEYYEKFYDWAESTQVRNLSGLTSLGNADEVAEIIIEFHVNLPASDRLLKKAVEEKLAFSAYDLAEFIYNNDKELATSALYNSVGRLTSEDIEELYCVADDEDIIKICSENNLPLPEDLQDEKTYTEDFSSETSAPNLGLFGTIYAAVTGIGVTPSHKQKHNGKCSGDCANCPPHYGYRHGRWYYGHDHTHGCEFGGNKGSGSMN